MGLMPTPIAVVSPCLVLRLRWLIAEPNAEDVSQERNGSRETGRSWGKFVECATGTHGWVKIGVPRTETPTAVPYSTNELEDMLLNKDDKPARDDLRLLASLHDAVDRVRGRLGDNRAFVAGGVTLALHAWTREKRRYLAGLARGDVVLVRFGPLTYQGELNFPHPAIVLSVHEVAGNQSALVVPLGTSAAGKGRSLDVVLHPARGSGITKECVAFVGQLRTISVNRIVGNPKPRVSEVVLSEVEAEIRTSLLPSWDVEVKRLRARIQELEAPC